MRYQWIIVDGYNVLHQLTELANQPPSDLMGARHRLVRHIEETVHQMAPQATVVFDGREAGNDEALTSAHLEIFFSPANLSADSVIERLVCKSARPEKILVVTSDRAERDTVSSAGAQTMSAREFLEMCAKTNQRPIARRTPPGKEPKLGDLFPDSW